MPICINQNGDVFDEFLPVSEEEAAQMSLDFPVTHALVVARNKDGFLLLHNTWKNHWELPGGILEPGESLRECAIREMAEETNQTSDHVAFRGMMKFRLKDGRIEYGGLFCADIDQEWPFVINNEASRIVFWDGQQDIGYIDEIDKELLKYY